MKRDWDLIRKILLLLEELPDTASYLDSNEVEGFHKDDVAYHIFIMKQAGLIEAITSETMSDGMICYAKMMTWEGQEFLSKIRQQSAWNKVKGLIKNKGLDLSYEALKIALGAVITSTF